jgi:hypothetical protein
VKNLSAYSNGYEDKFNGQGASIFTNAAKGYGNITFSGVNSISNNYGPGLLFNINNYGNVSLSSVTADKNGLNGIHINYVDNGTTEGTISLKNVNTNYNSFLGLKITARSSISLNTVYAQNNGTNSVQESDGVSIIQNNDTALTTITNCVFTGNTDSGLEMDTNGGINPVITNTIYFGNDVNNDGGVKDVDIHD